MVQRFQNLDFSESSNWEPIFFLFGVDPLQGHDFVGLFVACNEHTSVCSFPDLSLLLEHIDVSQYNGRLDPYVYC